MSLYGQGCWFGEKTNDKMHLCLEQGNSPEMHGYCVGGNHICQQLQVCSQQLPSQDCCIIPPSYSLSCRAECTREWNSPGRHPPPSHPVHCRISMKPSLYVYGDLTQVTLMTSGTCPCPSAIPASQSAILPATPHTCICPQSCVP